MVRMIKKITRKVLDFIEVHKVDSYGNTRLHDAVRAGNIGLICDLIEMGADVNAQNRWGNTALHLAAEYGLFRVSKWMSSVLLNAGADPNIKNVQGVTPLDLGLCYEHLSHTA